MPRLSMRMRKPIRTPMARPIRMPMRKQVATPIRRTTMVIIMAMTTTSTSTTSIATTTIITAIPMLMTTNKPPAKPRRNKVVEAADKAVARPLDVEGISATEAAALYRLMTWLSPAFPVGAFSYSSGIEWAVEAGDITDAASLRDWLVAMLADGPGFCDGVFLAHAHRAASLRDDATLRDVAELAAAFVPSRERQLEPSGQGRAFSDCPRAA